MTTSARTLPQYESFPAQQNPEPRPQESRPQSERTRRLPRPQWLRETIWPFETLALEVDGSPVAVTDVGEGPALLFVHTGFWSFIWRDVMTRLADEFRCVCLDAPGAGLSALPRRGPIGLEGSSHAVAAVIDALDLRNFTLVVHDLGGPAGLAGAARRPERVRGIAAVNAFGWRPSGTLFRGMLAWMGSGLMREFDALTQILPRISASNFGAGRHLDTDARNTFLAGIGREGVRTFHDYLRSARKSEALYGRVADALQGAFRTLPLLTIFGEHNDPLGFQPRWKNLFPGATQVIVPGGNHFPMCDDPELVARTLRAWHRETGQQAPQERR